MKGKRGVMRNRCGEMGRGDVRRDGGGRLGKRRIVGGGGNEMKFSVPGSASVSASIYIEPIVQKQPINIFSPGL